MATERYIEAVTASGMVVSLRCPEDKIEAVKEALAAVRELDIPGWREPSQVAHGGYAALSRFRLTQHDYAGGGDGGICGYVEVLEIGDPPEERHNIVLHSFNTREGHAFAEYDTVTEAKAALRRCGNLEESAIKKTPGLRRHVPCGWLTPWFYAIGQQVIIGDYALAPGLEDHPLYTLGRLFVVTELNEKGVPAKKVKRCLGCRSLEVKPMSYCDHDDRSHFDHLVYWNDGSCTRIGKGESGPAVPYTDEIEWIREAAEGCGQLLAGGENPFRINLVDGRSFIGFLTSASIDQPSAFSSQPGTYLAEIILTNGEAFRGTVPFSEADRAKYGTVLRKIQIQLGYKRPGRADILIVKLWPYNEKEGGIPYDQRDKPVVYFSPAGQLTGS
ncbi:MAG: hypothetical protein AAB360_00520 [Patescibacteria group bacterium]